MNDKILFAIAEFIGAPLVKLIGVTLKIKTHGDEHLQHCLEKDSHVYSLFHGRMFIPVWHHRHQGITTLVSQSKDGEAVTRLVKHLGHSTIRGSANRGGAKSIVDLSNALKNGNVVAMMIDGSKGPIYEPKIGTVAIARLSGTPILPICSTTTKFWKFKSWDRFQLPKPFSKGVLVYEEPLYVPKSAKGEKLEEYRVELKRRMLLAKEKAERLTKEL